MLSHVPGAPWHSWLLFPMTWGPPEEGSHGGKRPRGDSGSSTGCWVPHQRQGNGAGHEEGATQTPHVEQRLGAEAWVQVEQDSSGLRDLGSWGGWGGWAGGTRSGPPPAMATSRAPLGEGQQQLCPIYILAPLSTGCGRQSPSRNSTVIGLHLK